MTPPPAPSTKAPEIATPRLVLSPYVPADADALVLNANHRAVARMMSTVPHPFTREQALARIEKRRCGADRFTLAIRDRQTGEAVGEIGAGAMEPGEPPQIGYFLRPDIWGRGLAGEALTAALGHALGTLDWPLIEGEVLDGNPASARVLTRAGFRAVGASTCASLARDEAEASTVHRLTQGEWATPVLRTPRLTLRPRAMADAPRHAALIGDYEVSKMLAVVPHPYTLADSHEWLSGGLDDPRDSHFAIDRGEGLLGIVTLSWKAVDRRGFGFWLGRPHWGQGLMSEAVRTVIDWAFRERHVARIDSEAYLENSGSRRIHAQHGFCEGERRMAHSLARGCEVAAVPLTLTREDWTPTP